MLETFVLPELRRHRELRRTWFQQDGATPHTTNISIHLLQQNFPGRLISKRGDIEWPPRSPDLNPPDFFLWGHLKEEVFKTKPTNTDELKQQIRNVIVNISQDTLQAVTRNCALRFRDCFVRNGAHFEHVFH